VTEALRAGLRRLDEADGLEAVLGRLRSPWRSRSFGRVLGASELRPCGFGRDDRARGARAGPVRATEAGTGVVYRFTAHSRWLRSSRRAQRRTPVAFASLRSASEPVTIQLPSEPVLYEMAFDVGAEPAAEYALTIVKPAVEGDARGLFGTPRCAGVGRTCTPVAPLGTAGAGRLRCAVDAAGEWPDSRPGLQHHALVSQDTTTVQVTNRPIARFRLWSYSIGTAHSRYAPRILRRHGLSPTESHRQPTRESSFPVETSY
jgi:hypothetical protein